MSTRTFVRFGVVALVASLAACADSNAPTATVSDAILTADAANDAGQSVAMDVAQMTASETDAGVPSTSAPAQAGSAGCTYSAGTGRFVCPTVTTQEGLSLDRSFAYFAGGAAQQAYDATATDSINFQWALAGSMSANGATAWVNATRSATVSGLAGTETQRSWSGTGARTDSAVFHGTDSRVRRTKVVASSAVSNVVFKLPRSTYPYPQSGSITHDVTISSAFDGAAGSTGRTATRHVVVTFDGTRTAQMTVGTTHCTVDLVTRVVSCGQ